MSQGWYVPTTAPEVPEQRILEQSARLPPDGAVTGWASLRLHGAAFFDGLAPDGRSSLRVPLAVGQTSKIRGDSQVVVSREPLTAEEVTIRHGIPCTVVRRALFDEMRRTRDVREAVVAMDMAAAALLVSIGRERAYHSARRGWRRSRIVAEALDLASERSRSPNETRTRLIWLRDARLPAPLVNQHLWDLEGNLLGIADFLDVDAGLVGEYDGADHRGALRHTKDIAREEGFRRHRLGVFRVTGLDLSHRDRVVERILFHRSRASWLPPAQRTWTIVPPPGWRPEQSLDDFLDEEELLQRLSHADPPDLPLHLGED